MGKWEKKGSFPAAVDLLDSSVQEIAGRVAKMEVNPIPAISEDFLDWDSFLLKTKGDYEAIIAMSAQRSVLCEIARNMKGKSDISEVDIAVYVSEYYNILCGFFVSAINRRLRLKARFGIPEFTKARYIRHANFERDVAASLSYECVHGKFIVRVSGLPAELG